ncbi:MAG: aminopeptidase, partial [Woeseiaceae bacterium]|nr:aminopeptidase [Woeseiaceae bacterium]
GDPDDFQGTIHYSKGSLFLQHLETAFGRSTFDRFLFQYFKDFAFKTITTERFLDYLDKNLLQSASSRVHRADVEQWLYQPGLPGGVTVPTSSTLAAAATFAATWASGEVELAGIPFDEWSPHAIVHFINSLPAGLPDERLQQLDEGLGLSTTRNAEIGRTWFIQVATRRHRPAYDAMAHYLNRYGRGRLVRPVYVALADNGADLELARELYARARASYHPYVKNSVARALGVKTD